MAGLLCHMYEFLIISLYSSKFRALSRSPEAPWSARETGSTRVAYTLLPRSKVSLVLRHKQTPVTAQRLAVFAQTHSCRQTRWTHPGPLPRSLMNLQTEAPLGHRRTRTQILTWRGGSHWPPAVTEGGWHGFAHRPIGERAFDRIRLFLLSALLVLQVS